jgi:serine/threonine-protein kinase RsbW
MIMKLYEMLGVTHHYHQPDSVKTPFKVAETVVKVELNDLEGCAVIYVQEYGEDTVMAIRKALRALCVKSIRSLNMMVKLTDPLTYSLTEEFEKMGFFFAGILPDSLIGDALILQYLNNVEFDYSKVVIYQDFTKEILAYIRAHDPNEGL